MKVSRMDWKRPPERQVVSCPSLRQSVFYIRSVLLSIYIYFKLW